MKKQCLLGFVLVSLLTLIGCKAQLFSPTEVNEDYLHESWMQQINLDPNKWLQFGGPWYSNGQHGRSTSAQGQGTDHAMSIMNVRVPDFTALKVDGHFKVQIVGGQQHNSVYIAGPEHLVRQVVAEMDQNTLYVHAAKGCKDPLDTVVVRIGINNIRSITNLGPATIMGRYLTSDHLVITNCSDGCVLLQGRMTLVNVTQMGSGTVTVVGACTPSLKITVTGNGNVNVSGRVGVNNIVHKGDGKVNVIGANGAPLCITASGNGTTKVVGCTNLQGVTASGNSRVYAYWVKSNGLHVYASGCAQIGLAGDANNINLDLTGMSRFQGQDLHIGNLYVRTNNTAHATVTADKKIFAAAMGNSSIYFYGSPDIVSRYTSDSGVVIPVWTKSSTLPLVRYKGAV